MTAVNCGDEKRRNKCICGQIILWSCSTTTAPCWEYRVTWQSAVDAEGGSRKIQVYDRCLNDMSGCWERKWTNLPLKKNMSGFFDRKNLLRKRWAFVEDKTAGKRRQEWLIKGQTVLGQRRWIRKVKVTEVVASREWYESILSNTVRGDKGWVHVELSPDRLKCNLDVLEKEIWVKEEISW